MTYHHGNLRAALLERAVAVIDEQGVDALSIRQLARDAGVSHGASTRHFPDRRALLDAVAVAGFERLEAHMRASGAEVGRPSRGTAGDARTGGSAADARTDGTTGDARTAGSTADARTDGTAGDARTGGTAAVAGTDDASADRDAAHADPTTVGDAELRASFVDLAWAYAAFATAHPRLVDLMYGSALADGSSDELRAAAYRAVGPVEGFIRIGQATGAVRDGDPGLLAIALFSPVHGVAGLVTSGLLGGVAVDDAVEAVIASAWRGIVPDAAAS